MAIAVEPSSFAASSQGTARYRRQARRLRHQFRRDPVALHLSLKALADQEDASAQVTSVRRQHLSNDPTSGLPAARVVRRAVQAVGDFDAVLIAPQDRVARFSLLVRAMLDEGFLRYSQRQSLLRSAGKLGIGQFEATLIIAAVEHRELNGKAAERHLQARRTWMNRIPIVAALLLGEAVAVAAVWILA